MGQDSYGVIAPYYDSWNEELDYARWADGIEKAFSAHYPLGVKDILDLGCGSGRMAVELARRGYGIVGVDASADMLMQAREHAEQEGVGQSCLWLLQDMTAFELYGTVEAVVSCLDTVNHLTNYRDLRQMLALVHNYLAPGGLFLFDLNSRHKFETEYADRAYTMERDGDFLIWQNAYHPKTHIADFYITLFQQERGGNYRRSDEHIRERMYPTSAIKKELEKAGFSLLSIGDTPYGDTVGKEADRLYFVARCEKP